MMVAPDTRSHGGIATVIENYRKSEFWMKCRCVHFPSYRDWRSKWTRLAYSLWQYVLFIRTLICSRPAVIGIHTASRGSFYRKLGFILLSRLFARVVVLHIHPSFFFQFFSRGNPLQRILVRAACRASKRLVFLTEENLAKFRPAFPELSMSVIPNPVDVTAFDTCARAAMKGNYQVAFLGWIVKEKGVYDILDAIPFVVHRFPAATFLFAGNKEVENLDRTIHSRGLSKYARVLGWIEGDMKRDLLLASRLLLLPSYTEGVPNVILEAMAAGLPVITTPVGGIPSVFSEGVNGYFVNPGDAASLAARILSMFENDGECERISSLTRQVAEQRYAVETIGCQLSKVYEPLLQECAWYARSLRMYNRS
jgi:glycosyltransferase involved in cell wall biosynthesis